MNRRFSSGKSQLIGQGIVYPLPIPLDPAPYIGAMVAGSDEFGSINLYFSDGLTWRQHIADTTITTIIQQFIDDLTLVGYDEENLPNPLDPLNLRRFAFNNDKGLPGFVWNDMWNYLADEARVAEIAEEVAADAIRVQPELLDLTVGDDGDYQLLSEALRAASFFSTGYVKQTPFVTLNKWCRITILSGTVIDEQIEITAPMPGVFIEAEDEVVDVDVSGFQSVSAAEGAPFLRFLNTVVAPTIGCVFREVSRPSGLPTVGVSNYSTSMTFARSDDPTDILNLPDATPLLRRRGLEGFENQITLRGAYAFCSARLTDLLNPTQRCITAFNQTRITCRGARMKGWSINAIRLDNNSQAGWGGIAGDLRTTFHGFEGERSDFRQDDTISPNDINFASGAFSRWATPNTAFYAGFSIPAQTLTSAGMVTIGGSSVLNWGGSSIQTSRRSTVAGTANALTITTGSGLHAAPITGLEIRFRATAANTGAATIALDGGTAIACRTVTGDPLPPGYIRTNADTVARYNGTNWILDRQDEVGSNPNGTWIRRANGKQECSIIGFTLSFTNAGNCQSDWPYPAEFTSAPVIGGIINASSTISNIAPNLDQLVALAWVNSGSNAITARMSVRRVSGAPDFVSGNSVTLQNLTAKGRWY